MLKTIATLLTILILISCSSTSKNIDAKTSLKDQRVSTDFTDEGIKITYTLFGKLDKIEVYGQADAWKGNVEALAEADAYAKLVKFIRGTQVSTERRTKIIGTAIEKAEDNSLKKYMTNDGVLALTDKQIETEANSSKETKNTSGNEASRIANIVNTSTVTTLTTITAQGRLTGIRKVNDYKQNDGKLYVAVYRWSEQDQAASEYVRDRMNGVSR
jgi:hypothetical protein